MKNQYFGDLTDYRKYGLLRCFSEAGLRVGVAWMLSADGSSRDGRRTAYLRDPAAWRGLDPPLFDFLRSCVHGAAGRSVQTLERSELLPDARFHTQILSDGANARHDYFCQAMRNLDGCDLIFFDADNGLEVASVLPGRRGSSRYLYWSEVVQAWDQGVSLLIFQHYTRQPRTMFSRRLCVQLAERLGGAVEALTTAHVVFLIAAQKRHSRQISSAIHLTNQRWAGQIEKMQPLGVNRRTTA